MWAGVHTPVSGREASRLQQTAKYTINHSLNLKGIWHMNVDSYRKKTRNLKSSVIRDKQWIDQGC